MRTFKISQFEWEGKRYVLKEPVEAIEENYNDLWVYKVNQYELHSFSHDKEEAYAELHEEFYLTYKVICLEDDENLTPEAIKLKNKMLANIERVEEV